MFSFFKPAGQSRHWLLLICSFLALSSGVRAEEAAPWWDKEWPIRKAITIDTSASGTEITEPIGTATVLIRLHDGIFQFASAKEDGSDLRFVAADGKTQLNYHLEKYDSLLNEAFVWVKVPDLKPGAKTVVWMYYGNAGPKAVPVGNPKTTYDTDAVVVYHFAERGQPATDSSPAGNNAETAGLSTDGALIGGGLRLDGKTSVKLPASPTLAWTANGALTWTAWLKVASLQPNATIFTRREGASGFTIGIDNGTPYVEVNGQRAAGAAPLAVNVWRHLAVVADAGKLTLYLDGESAATLAAELPALNSPAFLGRDGSPDAAADAIGAAGELDELEISKAARPLGAIKFAALSQSGNEKSAKLLVAGADEGSAHSGGSKALEHMMLFGDIAKNMMFDGWIAVGVCLLMIITGWTVAIRKFFYLNSIQKGSDLFLEQWAHVSSDLTALDHDDEESVKSFGGNASKKTMRDVHRSPLYHLYKIGSEEIRHRLGGNQDRSKGLSARSMQAIRASLESGLVRENHHMNSGLIFLTISIAGGPYVGLLGTVVGVMITFAIIAKSGEVDVNSIAPGIASALLATVAGLLVAIPALFIYSYLSSRIKDLISAMQVFIDEFIAKMAEFYPTPADVSASHFRESSLPARTPQPAAATSAEASNTNHHAS